MSDNDDVKDLEEILPPAGELKVDGIPVTVRRLKTREFLALLRVLTTGFGPGLSSVKLDFDDEEELTQDLTAILLLAIPDAAEEFVDFLRVVVEPRAKKDEKKLATAMENPEIEDLMVIVGTVVEQEKDDLRGLAGKAQAMWSRLAPKNTGPEAKKAG